MSVKQESLLNVHLIPWSYFTFSPSKEAIFHSTHKFNSQYLQLAERKLEAKAQLELNLATVVRDNKKGFYKYINNKKKAK